MFENDPEIESFEYLRPTFSRFGLNLIRVHDICELEIDPMNDQHYLLQLSTIMTTGTCRKYIPVIITSKTGNIYIY